MTMQGAEAVLVAALVCVIVALVGQLVALTSRRQTAPAAPALKRAATVGAAVIESGGDLSAAGPDGLATPSPRPAPTGPAGLGVAGLATALTVIAAVLLSVYLGWRVALTGHGPFANQHEFAVAFAWSILVAGLIALRRFRLPVLTVVVLPVVACLLLYALRLDTAVAPLVPALQNNLLLSLHVGFAVLSYGAACVSFGGAVVYLLHPKLKLTTPRERFDAIGYQAAVVAFPLMTMMIVLGALWAETAWGRFWGWDPKETAALVTWLIYAGFLHARLARGWRGTKSAVLLVVGFAAVLFVYLGNSFLGGLHAYA